jgi:membrane-bound ClpP family serine protease
MGNFTSRTITGAILFLGGLALIALSFFVTVFLLIYGIPLFIMGLIIFFNKREDRIEERKDLNKKKSKK